MEGVGAWGLDKCNQIVDSQSKNLIFDHPRQYLVLYFECKTCPACL